MESAKLHINEAAPHSTQLVAFTCPGPNVGSCKQIAKPNNTQLRQTKQQTRHRKPHLDLGVFGVNLHPEVCLLTLDCPHQDVASALLLAQTARQLANEDLLILQ